jgi:hypothetical protein
MRGYVSLGISHDTPLFAVEAIRRWWLDEGRERYVTAVRLLIEADCDGSNGNRNGLWLLGLQAFADEFGVTVTVTHYPSGASKWNPVEHRMFSPISCNWAGQPLTSYETALEHIRATISTTGFRCTARLDRHAYELGLKATPDELAAVRLRRHRKFPTWNYTISPRNSRKSPT